ncbi:NUC173-domain-containing protein [Jaminaea rosea]|uniref:NUC173-domain-containing protein n=1 Tax=Jaminaea rosea TaxID=1569628 RepID=A0A316UIC0_9BASI|nr:NUC173-domain-containing protein [Jaminaea rosea]PWN24618.1 NUC173-domain-containing protein [Jaminaea rosea]
MAEQLAKLRSLTASKLDNQKAPAQLLVAIEESLDESQPTTSTKKERSPAEYFLALDSMLHRGNNSTKLLPSIFYILAIVTPHVSAAILRARLPSLLPPLYSVLSNPHSNEAEQQAALLRSSIAVLEALIAIVGEDRQLLQTQQELRASWDASLALCADSRPKVRRRAQDFIGSALSSQQHPYAARTATWCSTTLSSVSDSASVTSKKGKATAAAAAAATYDVKKGRATGAQEAAKQRQENVAGGASVGIWVCGFLKAIVTRLPDKAIPQLCEELLRLPGLHNPFLTVAAFEVFEALYRPAKSSTQIAADNLPGSSGAMAAVAAAQTPAKKSAPSSLLRTLEALRSSALQPASNDVQLLPPYLRALEGAIVAYSRYDEGEPAWALVPQLWNDVMELSLSARSDASRSSITVRSAGADFLASLVRYAVPDEAIKTALKTKSSPLHSLVTSLDDALGRHALRFTHSRGEILGVLTALVTRLRLRVGVNSSPAATQLLIPLITTVAALRQTPKFEHRDRADAVLGAATEVCGPEAILTALPLNLLAGNGQGRAWLLPLMKGRITNTSLGHFVRDLVPLSEKLFNARTQAQQDASRGVEAKMYEALVEQLWSLFPGYCDLPTDLVTALSQPFAELLANVLATQQALRPSILRGLTLLVDRNEALSRSGASDESLRLTFGLTAADGKAALTHLIGLAPAFLSVFSHLLAQSPSSSRGYITEAIGAFLRILPASEVSATYGKVAGQLKTALTELVPQRDREVGPHAVPPLAHSMLDLLITLVPFLPAAEALALFKAATSDDLLQNDDAGVQKKTYRVLARLLEGSKGAALATSANVTSLLTTLREVTVAVAPGAKRDRLHLLSGIVPRIPLGDLHLLPSIIPEAVLATKEANQASRTLAYELLVQMGEKMQQEGGKIKRGLLLENDDKEDEQNAMDTTDVVDASLTEYLTMVSAGLAGNSPHMISATITSLSRLVYEFKEQLPRSTLEEVVSTMSVFLTSSPNREIIKSVLGFVKVSIVSLEYDVVDAALPEWVPGMLEWKQHPAHRVVFKGKVRHIFERLLRRFGYERIESLCDEENRKLVVNIKKRKERAKRKKASGGSAGHAGEDEEDDVAAGAGAPGAKAPRRDLGVDAFEEALYGSDSDVSSDDSGEEDIEQGGAAGGLAALARKAAGARQGKGQKPEQQQQQQQRRRRRDRDDDEAYLLEDDDAPMDLLDRSAGAVVHRKPAGKDAKDGGKRRAPGTEARRFDLDESTGRMLINDPEDEGSAGPAGNGASADLFGPSGAYVERETGTDGFTHSGRGGAVKFNKNNKRVRAEEREADLEAEEAIAAAEAARADVSGTSSAAAKRPKKAQPERIGASFAAKKKGAKGDVKKAGGPDPYAYVPLSAVGGKKGSKQERNVQITGKKRR